MSIQEDIQKAIANNELYPIGENAPNDWQQAYDMYLQLAKSGNAKAQYNLGYMFARGDLMDQDLKIAFEWYQKAAENNDPRAHYNLAKMYELGEFVLPDITKAKEHMSKATELGDSRAKMKAVLATAKETLKHGDRIKAKALFESIAADCKEAEMGIIACSVAFKSRYKTRIVYTYHSSGEGQNKKYWKWGDNVKTEVDLAMTNQSTHSWKVMVKALIRAGDGFIHISNIAGVLKAGETQSNIIDPDEYGKANICGVNVYSDLEGSLNLPVYTFHFPDISLKPDEEETQNLNKKIQMAQAEMEKQNKTAKPGGCFVLTACYGSYDAPTVLAFRQFRDNHLAQYTLGRHFISWYYTHGPKMAKLIEDKPRIRGAFRILFNNLAKALPK